MTSVYKNSLDLEVKHTSNGSWYPCRVSVRSDHAKIGIVVNFENSEEEDIMYDKEEALTRLRFRSAPLQNGECSLIKEGDSVLALYKDQYFDAVIEKPHRVKHSNRVSCRCNFEIKLQNSKLRGKTITVPSKSISKLSSKEIVSDTIFTSFLNDMDPSNVAKSPSSLFCDDDDDDADVEGGIDIDGMLDKQIEQISESVNCHTKNFEDKKATFGSQGISKRSTRSQKKQQAEKKRRNVREEDKTFLSPLAARAALASLVHDKELPIKENYLSIPMEKLWDNQPLQKGASSDKKVKTPVRVTHSREKNISQESTSRITRNSKSKEVEVSESVAKSVVDEDKTYSSPLSVSATTPASNGPRKQNTGKATRSSGSKGIKILSDKEKSGSSRGKIVRPDNTRKTRFSTSKEVKVLENEAKKESPSVEKFASPVSGKNYGNSKTRTTRSSITESLPDEALESSTGEKLTSPSARLTRSRDKELHTDSEDVTPNKKMRALASPSGTSDKSGGNMEETSGKKKKSARQKEISSQKPQLRSSPRFKPSAKT